MSIKTIAAMTELSITTVSHALNGTRPVSKRSKALIEEAVRQTGYKPNLAAQMLKTNRSHIIALLIPATEPNNSTNCFFFDVLNGAREMLQQSGYDLMVATYSERESEKHLANLQLLEKRLVDGILLVPFDRSSSSLDTLRSLGMPIVLVDRRCDDSGLPSVYADNRDGARQAVRLLAGSGRVNIAFLCGRTEFSTSYDRSRGYYEEMEALGLAVRPELVFTELPYQFLEGYRLAPRLLERGADAIFCANNVLLMGVLESLQEHNITVPSDVSVVGFDDYDWMRVAQCPITAPFQDPYRMGAEAARLLLETLDGGDTAGREVMLPCNMVLRQSHKPGR